jgi:hypothetical protein
MSTDRFLAVSLVVLSVAALAWADGVVMYNGQRLEGQIVGETEDEVSLRQTRPDGVTYIRKIHKFNITRVEKGNASASQPASAPADLEDQAPAAPPVQPDGEKLALLESAMTKYDQQNYTWGGFFFSQLINKSTPGELSYMSAEVSKRKNMTLAEMAALCHFKAAEPGKPGQRVRLPYVTVYERPAMLKLLKRAHEEALGQYLDASGQEKPQVATETTVRKRPQPQAENLQVLMLEQHYGQAGKPEGPPLTTEHPAPAGLPRPTATRPVLPAEITPPPVPKLESPPQNTGRANPPTPGQVMASPPAKLVAARPTASRPAAWPSQRPSTAIDWLDRPEEYDGTRAEAEALVNHVQYTMSLLNERIRLDAKVQRDPALKTALLQEKERLNLLLRAAKAQAKGTLTPQERKAILAARKRLADSHRKEFVPRELLIEEFVNQGRKSGPPPGKYPTTSGSGNMELVPVDVNFP